MLTPRCIIAFTGHRELKDETVTQNALRTVLAELQGRVTARGGQANLYSSIAAGADVLCVETARALEIPVHLILPLDEEDFSKDFTPNAWSRSLQQLRATPAAGGTVRIADGSRVRPACYFDAGAQMLEASDVLVAVWDGEPAQGLGGTAEIVELARHLKKPVVWIQERDGTVKFENFFGESPEKIPDEWPPQDPVMSELNSLAAETCSSNGGKTAEVNHLMECLGAIAEREGASFRPGTVAQIALHSVAALIAAWACVRPLALLTSIEFFLVVAALFTLVLLDKRRAQPRWLKSRFATELLRGLRCSIPMVDPLHPLIAHHMPEWRRFAVSAGLLVQQARPAAMSVEDWKRAYANDRLDDQIKHFRGKGGAARKIWNFSHPVAVACAWSAPFFVAFSLANKLAHWQLQDFVWGALAVMWLPIALPLIAGAASGVRSALDVGRRRERYPQMIERLQEAKLWLAGARTSTGLSNTVRRTEEMLVDELVEWHVAAHNSGAH